MNKSVFKDYMYISAMTCFSLGPISYRRVHKVGGEGVRWEQSLSCSFMKIEKSALILGTKNTQTVPVYGSNLSLGKLQNFSCETALWFVVFINKHNK